MRPRRMLLMLATVLLLTTGYAVAETAQQAKMKTCNAEATQKGLKGEARKTFMSSCLSAKPAAGNSQQEKMKTCNAGATAKGLKGDARNAFMKSCLSGK